MTTNTRIDDEDAIADSALEAPLVVRVELARVTLTAAEWSELRPGDVLTTDRPLGDPAVLRAGGREIASGELVSVEGKLGVRIQSVGRGR